MSSRSRVVGATAKAASPTRPGIAQGINLITSTRKHSVTASGKTAPVGGTTAKHRARSTANKGTKRRRGWSADVQCCTAEALGLLLGWDHRQVLDLYWRTAQNPDAGATIEATLQACGEFLGGSDVTHAVADGLDVGVEDRLERGDECIPLGVSLEPGHALILGVLLPEPHAIAVADGAWWSWGEPFNPADWPELVIDEAWEVGV